jgi:hypothetical protein
MAQRFENQPPEPDADRRRSGDRLAPFLLIAAVVLLIVIAAISLN